VTQLIASGRCAEGETAARELLIREETESGESSVEVARVLDVLVEAMVCGGKATEPETRLFAERAVAIKKAVLGLEHPEVAQSLSTLANVLYRMRDYDGAQPIYRQALVIREAALGSEHPEVAESLQRLGNLLYRTGAYGAARPLMERALAIREKALGSEHPGVAISLDRLGSIAWRSADYSRAKQMYERALSIREKAFGPEHPDVASSLTHLANVLDDTGNRVAAEPMYLRALDIREKALGPEHPHVANSLLNLGILYRGAGDYAAAKPLFERAMAIREKVLGPDSPVFAYDLYGLAKFFCETGEYEKAKELHERALAIRITAFGLYHPDVADSLLSLGEVFANLGLIEESLETLLRSASVVREQLRRMAPTMTEREALLYAVHTQDPLELALAIVAQSESTGLVMDAVIRSRARVLDEMARRNRRAHLADNPEVEQAYQRLASARQRLAKLVVTGPGGEPPDRYQDLLDVARKEKEAAERALGEKSVSLGQELARAQAGLKEIAAALPTESGIVSFARSDRSRIKNSSSQESSSSRASYQALVVRSDNNEPSIETLGSVEQIDGLVLELQEHLSRVARDPEMSPKRAEAIYRQAAGALRRAIWDPLEPHLADLDAVFVVPDGTLNLVSFAALPVNDSDYLIEKGPRIHYLSAERDLILEDEDPQGAGLLAVGDPAFDEPRLFAALASQTGEFLASVPRGETEQVVFRGARSSCGDFQEMRFERLPASVDELDEIVALWESRSKGPNESRRLRNAQKAGSDFERLEGASASEAALKRMAPGRRVLHLATHGFFLGGHCQSAPDSGAGVTTVTENPLLRSGLAMAGANLREAAGPEEEDGVLTAEEIAALDLNGVEWAVLSACETGLGEVRIGEGVLGLRRAFSVAGARTLIMSLWQVEDEPTRDWMKLLYRRRYIDGLRTAEAVHQASLGLLHSRRQEGLSTHPFYWAGFVASGDWR
jgi:CHAT domain-containing protein/Tfp pilus assembly protein PilF